MLTKAEKSQLCQLDQEIKSLGAGKIKIQMEKGKQLLAVDREIEKSITKINKFGLRMIVVMKMQRLSMVIG